MRWENREESSNIDDRRGLSGGKAIAGGGLVTVVIAVVVMLLGGDPRQVIEASQGLQGGSRQSSVDVNSPEQQKLKKFVGVVLADTEKVWTEVFQTQVGREYVKPKLVLFNGQVESACGSADAAMGPFYCGEDQQVYIDLGFYQLLKERFGAPGDFAQAYVIAHEVGHHVQNLLGTMMKVHAKRSGLSEKQYNALSVRLELQADFYAGVWANKARQMASLDEQDIREAVTAASAIGDDAIQMQSQGQVVPDAFTHGSSEQRVKWFMAGWKSGQLRDGDTFNTRDL